MKIKLPYKLINNFMPTDNTRSYLCFSLIEPGSDGVSSLCIDEGAFKSVLRRCKTEQDKDFIMNKIFRSINKRVYSGQFSGKISLEV